MRRFPFRSVEPTFFAGLLDDPVLYVRVRPQDSAFLFDCGQIHHLAKRVLRSVTHLFISHAHMDHFMGMDTFIRNNHVSSRTVDIYGPPGIAGKTACKLAAFDWNLAEPSWCTFRVHEIHSDRTAIFILPGAEGFPCRLADEQPRRNRIIHQRGHLMVEAELCDHMIPSVIYRVTEPPPFEIDQRKLDQAGLIRGEWLRLLEKLFRQGFAESVPVPVLRREEENVEMQEIQDAQGLYDAIRTDHPAAAIGYISDIGFSDKNKEKVTSLMAGVTLLVCECSFLAAHRDKARI